MGQLHGQAQLGGGRARVVGPQRIDPPLDRIGHIGLAHDLGHATVDSRGEGHVVGPGGETGAWPAVSPSTTSVTRAAAIFSSTISPGNSHAQVIVPRLVAPRAGGVLADQLTRPRPVAPMRSTTGSICLKTTTSAPCGVQTLSVTAPTFRPREVCIMEAKSALRSAGSGDDVLVPRRALAILMSSATTQSAPTPRQSHWNTPSAWARARSRSSRRLALVLAVGEQDGVPYAGLVARAAGWPARSTSRWPFPRGRRDAAMPPWLRRGRWSWRRPAAPRPGRPSRPRGFR